MTPEQIILVQNSFGKVLPIQETAAQLFYGRLFELDPSLEHLFHTDMTEQGRRLMGAIDNVVRHLEDLESILPTIRDLGRRHAGYGVEPRHYDTVAAALLWTLEQGLGDDFTDDTKQAWATAYGLLSSTMMDAAQSQTAQPS